MDIGTRLREARERAGLSREQISDATKVKIDRIVALEDNAFDELPSGIYLHGIVRAYAHEVGLDADGLIAEVRNEDSPPDPSDLARLAVLTERRRHAEEHDNALETFDPEPVHVSPPAAARSRATFAHGLALGLLIALLLAAFGTGGYLYTNRRTRTAAAVKVEPSSSAISREDASPPPPPGAIPAPTAGTTETTVPVVSGVWQLSTRVESASLQRFRGLRLGYVVDLQQNGDRVSGRGRKVAENGRRLPSAAQTPITMEGTLKGDRLTMTFNEHGARRASSGRFDLSRSSNGRLIGTFSSGAARSSGTAVAHRR